MTDHNVLIDIIDDYFDRCLNRGMTLMDITEQLRDQLPTELLNSGYDPKLIKRVGQWVSTRRFIQDTKEQSAELPAFDLIAAD